MSHACWILILNLLFLKATSSQQGSWTFEIGNNNYGGGYPEVYGVELSAMDFDRVLTETPATYAIVEFYTYWCSSCEKYEPHFEKVARLFNGPDAVHPGVVLMARVDCAFTMNSHLCDKFSVDHYPMLFWGPATEFTSVLKPNEAKSQIRVIDDWRTADRLLNWINWQIGSSYGLDDEIEQIPSDKAIREIGVNVCALVRERLAIESNKAFSGEPNLFDLGDEITARLAEEFGTNVDEESSQIITTEDATYVIQKLCSQVSG